MRENISSTVIRRLRAATVLGTAAASVVATGALAGPGTGALAAEQPGLRAATAQAGGQTFRQATSDSSPLRSPVTALVRSEVRGVGAKSIVLPSTRITARWSRSIDTRRRGAVNYAYWRQYAPYRNVSTGWTGSILGCHAGSTSTRSHTATRSSINFVRSLNGLAPISFGSATMNRNAIRTALMMSANTTLSHFPTASWLCYSYAGDRTAAKSNLALALPSITSGRIVDMYMDDRGSENVAVGHRRWVLYPFTRIMGNGSTSSANALQVVGPTSSTRPNPRWTSWPSSGYFPSTMEPAGRWSLSSGIRSEDFSRSVIRIWHNGHRIYPRRYAVHSGYGMPTVVWRMPAEASRVGTYKISVARITRPGLGRYYGHTYYVRIFRPWR